MWYSLHNRSNLACFGVFNEPLKDIPETQIQLEWAEDPAVAGEWIKPMKNPETGEIGLYENAELKQRVLMSRLRIKRDKLLAETDFTMLPDVKIDRAYWTAYRQYLRDLPAKCPDLANPVWGFQWPQPEGSQTV